MTVSGEMVGGGSKRQDRYYAAPPAGVPPGPKCRIPSPVVAEAKLSAAPPGAESLGSLNAINSSHCAVCRQNGKNRAAFRRAANAARGPRTMPAVK